MYKLRLFWLCLAAPMRYFLLQYQQSSQDVAVTIDNPPQLLMMGRSQDLGYCKSKTKAGRSCTQFINK